MAGRRIWTDTLPRRFGTVRPRVQIPGPDQTQNSKSAFLWSCLATPGHSRVTDSVGTSPTRQPCNASR
jgi:hypothetical protein